MVPSSNIETSLFILVKENLNLARLQPETGGNSIVGGFDIHLHSQAPDWRLKTSQETFRRMGSMAANWKEPHRRNVDRGSYLPIGQHFWRSRHEERNCNRRMDRIGVGNDLVYCDRCTRILGQQIAQLMSAPSLIVVPSVTRIPPLLPRGIQQS